MRRYVLILEWLACNIFPPSSCLHASNREWNEWMHVGFHQHVPLVLFLVEYIKLCIFFLHFSPLFLLCSCSKKIREKRVRWNIKPLRILWVPSDEKETAIFKCSLSPCPVLLAYFRFFFFFFSTPLSFTFFLAVSSFDAFISPFFSRILFSPLSISFCLFYLLLSLAEGSRRKKREENEMIYKQEIFMYIMLEIHFIAVFAQVILLLLCSKIAWLCFSRFFLGICIFSLVFFLDLV